MNHNVYENATHQFCSKKHGG